MKLVTDFVTVYANNVPMSKYGAMSFEAAQGWPVASDWIAAGRTVTLHAYMVIRISEHEALVVGRTPELPFRIICERLMQMQAPFKITHFQKRIGPGLELANIEPADP